MAIQYDFCVPCFNNNMFFHILFNTLLISTVRGVFVVYVTATGYNFPAFYLSINIHNVHICVSVCCVLCHTLHCNCVCAIPSYLFGATKAHTHTSIRFQKNNIDCVTTNFPNMFNCTQKNRSIYASYTIHKEFVLSSMFVHVCPPLCIYRVLLFILCVCVACPYLAEEMLFIGFGLILIIYIGFDLMCSSLTHQIIRYVLFCNHFRAIC